MQKIIVANWKCNPRTLKEAERLFNTVKNGIRGTRNVEVIICPPFVYLNSLKIENWKLKIQLGSQDCFWDEEGPYTGEISVNMLKNLRVGYVIIGHSERRKYFNETDEIINKKLKTALKVGLRPILCVGEKKGQSTKKIVNSQLKKDLAGISKKDLNKIIIAYEPVWAIGTGKFCPAEKANEIRKFIKRKFDNKILYGGSVNSKIAKDYIQVGFDGLLVGGASLDAKEFKKICLS